MKKQLTKIQIENLEWWDIYLPKNKIKNKILRITNKSKTDKNNTKKAS